MRVGGEAHPSGVDRLEARHHAQQGALAGPVPADDPDPLTGTDAGGHGGQERTVPVGLADGLEVDEVADGRHRAIVSGARCRESGAIVCAHGAPCSAMEVPMRLSLGSRARAGDTSASALPPTVPSLGNGLDRPDPSGGLPRAAGVAARRRSSARQPGLLRRLGRHPHPRRHAALRPAGAGRPRQHDPAHPRRRLPQRGRRVRSRSPHALDSARDTFRIVEIGAGWAPWSVAGIVQARRRGLRASGIAVEADETRSSWAMQHAADNDVRAELIEGSAERDRAQARRSRRARSSCGWCAAAGWHTSPRRCSSPTSTPADMGGAVWTLPGTDVDYRGAHLHPSRRACRRRRGTAGRARRSPTCCTSTSRAWSSISCCRRATRSSGRSA